MAGRRFPGIALATTALLAVWPVPLPASPPEAKVLLKALLEPSLADDGRISAEERDAIRKVARQILTAEQFAELDQRLGETGKAPVVPAAAEETAPGPAAGPILLAGPEAPVVPVAAEDTPPEGLLDNLSLFGGLDGSKQPQDLGINANLGGRTEVNGGLPLFEALGIGVQVGYSYCFYDNAVHVIDQIEGTNDRFQNFTTVGLFQRTAWGLSWGFVYDWLSEKYYDDFFLTQWRGQVGFAPTETDEFGVWFAVGDRNDRGVFQDTPVYLNPLTQANFYWQHTWPSRTTTKFWLGVAEGHGEVVFVFPENFADHAVLSYGAEIHVPLNDWFALYGLANMITPADTGTVDAYLGFAFYPGGGSRRARQNRFAPLLPVAGNPTFAVDLRR